MVLEIGGASPEAPDVSGAAGADGDSHDPSEHPRAIRIQWERDVTSAFERARREQRTIVVFVHASWSAAALDVERRVWSDARVARAVTPHVMLSIDVSAADGRAEAARARVQVERVPAVALLRADGSQLGALQGAIEAADVLELLQAAGRR